MAAESREDTGDPGEKAKEMAATQILITPVEFWSKVMGETKEEECCIRLRLAEQNRTRGKDVAVGLCAFLCRTRKR
ncbi:uncharacterized [Tachysurus ichikawai]